MIPVTKTFLPPINEYQKILERAWDKLWITNRGDLVLELESKLKEYLGVNNIIVMTNGTIPIQIALKLLEKKGEIITTPFSYVATTASIIWENHSPVFVDIDSDHLTIDETKIEEAITDKTVGILATHVFGNPCHVEAIGEIAKKHDLRVIYDAAHCFGVNYNGKSIFNYGDISTCSFHATKLFHCGEGGAVFCKDEELLHKLYYSHNFGHNGPLDFFGLGINGKISELQAAMGLSLFPYIDHIIESRGQAVAFYNDNIDFSNIKRLKIRQGTKWNNSYYPVVFESETILLQVIEKLNAVNIFPRRYFYPSLNTIEYVGGQQMTISESVAARIMCLPLFADMPHEALEQITRIINAEVQESVSYFR